MAVGFSKRARVGAVILAGVALVLGGSPSRVSAQAVPVYAESAADALARNVHILAESPRDFAALVAAGKAALQLGDTQAAAGFFGRAEEINPNSPLPKAGMGAALLATGDPNGALNYFAMAQRLGATAASLGTDRGLAYDLLGRQVAAQTDYRAAMAGPDRDEATRRLALSLAISGNKALALETLQSLLARRDVGAQRVRALVLALGGDLIGAKSVLDYAMPGTAASMDPFFRRLPTLSSADKAAAVHLGIFPEDGGSFAGATSREDRLASIEQILTGAPTQQAAQQSYAAPVQTVAPRSRPKVQAASAPKREIRQAAVSPSNDRIQTKRVASDPNGRKIWLQLASADSGAAFPAEFRKIRSREPSLFDGIAPFVAETGARTRLLIGPFHSQEDARLFSDALANARIDSFAWTSQPGQVVRQLPAQ